MSRTPSPKKIRALQREARVAAAMREVLRDRIGPSARHLETSAALLDDPAAKGVIADMIQCHANDLDGYFLNGEFYSVRSNLSGVLLLIEGLRALRVLVKIKEEARAKKFF